MNPTGATAAAADYARSSASSAAADSSALRRPPGVIVPVRFSYIYYVPAYPLLFRNEYSRVTTPLLLHYGRVGIRGRRDPRDDRFSFFFFFRLTKSRLHPGPTSQDVFLLARGTGQQTRANGSPAAFARPDGRLIKEIRVKKNAHKPTDTETQDPLDGHVVAQDTGNIEENTSFDDGAYV